MQHLTAATHSPLSDAGYGSASNTPWLEGEDCERFQSNPHAVQQAAGNMLRNNNDKHTLLQMDTSMESEASTGTSTSSSNTSVLHTPVDVYPSSSSIDAAFKNDPPSPSPPPAYQYHHHLQHQYPQREQHASTKSMYASTPSPSPSAATVIAPSAHSAKLSLSSSHNYGKQQHTSHASISSRRPAAAGLLPLSIASIPSSIPIPNFIPARPTSILESGTYWLTLYFFFNLSLTLYNKFALVSFPFPFSLTCIHSLTAGLGSYFCYKRGYFTRVPSLGMRENLILVAFSSLYTINIAVSNLSHNLVTVPLHQVVRSTTPLFTMIISIVLFGKSYLFETYLSLVPVMLGVCLATYGDYSGTAWGVFLTLFGAGLAAVKGIATNRILVGRLKFHPLDLLLRMSPLAFIQCLAFSYASGEMGEIYHRTFVTGALTRNQWISLGMNGTLAFGLNLVSFTANKKTGALTMSVAANVKQVLTIVLAVVLFNLHINGINLLGISFTIAGGAYYSYVEYKSKQAPATIGSLPGSSPLIGSSLPASDSHYYEKLSPRPDSVPNPFLSEQQQRMQTPQRNTTSTDSEKTTYHRKTNSLANFKYPRHGDQLSPPPF